MRCIKESNKSNHQSKTPLQSLIHVTTGVRSGIGLTRLIGLVRTDSIVLRQDGCLVKRREAMQERTEANRREMMAEIRAYSEKFEVLLGTRLPDGYPLSQDIDQPTRDESQDGCLDTRDGGQLRKLRHHSGASGSP
jgi:hypothetical protein